MTAVLQRVDRAECTVEGESTGKIGTGLLVLLGVAEGDTEADAAALYRFFAAELERAGVPVATGRFGADMRLSIEANGPVTIVMESGKLKKTKENGK